MLKIASFAILSLALTLPLSPTANAQNGPGIASPSLTDLSDQRRKRVQRPRRAAQAPNQIACTRFGCSPIPRGCQIVGERTWDGSPSGFDAVVCPRGY